MVGVFLILKLKLTPPRIAHASISSSAAPAALARLRRALGFIARTSSAKRASGGGTASSMFFAQVRASLCFTRPTGATHPSEWSLRNVSPRAPPDRVRRLRSLQRKRYFVPGRNLLSTVLARAWWAHKHALPRNRRRWTKNGKTRHEGLWVDPAGAVGAVEAGVACVGGYSWC
jgi:hypothetical protein